MPLIHEKHWRIVHLLHWVVGECIATGNATGAYVYARMLARYVTRLELTEDRD